MQYLIEPLLDTSFPTSITSESRDTNTGTIPARSRQPSEAADSRRPIKTTRGGAVPSHSSTDRQQNRRQGMSCNPLCGRLGGDFEAIRNMNEDWEEAERQEQLSFAEGILAC
eukprot:2200870-Rhodomonas_salina.1